MKRWKKGDILKLKRGNRGNRIVEFDRYFSNFEQGFFGKVIEGDEDSMPHTPFLSDCYELINWYKSPLYKTLIKNSK